MLAQIQRPVALAGRVPVKVDGAYGRIQSGDYLTSSATPGHAMAMTAAGPTIGRALQSWDSEEKGIILMFVQPGWYGGPSHALQRVEEPSRAGSSENRDAEGETIAREERVIIRETNVQRHPVSEAIEPGDVLVVDRQFAGSLRRSHFDSDVTVVGVVADAEPTNGGTALIATAGIVLVKVDASYGAVRPGDLLTTSATPGHARRSADAAPGTVLGKSLDLLDSGTGLIRMVVLMR